MALDVIKSGQFRNSKDVVEKFDILYSKYNMYKEKNQNLK